MTARKMQWHSTSSGDWYPSVSTEWSGNEVDHHLQTDEALIISTVSEALGQIAGQLQFLWTIKRNSGHILIKVKEEGEEEEGGVEYSIASGGFPHSSSNRLLGDEYDDHGGLDEYDDSNHADPNYGGVVNDNARAYCMPSSASTDLVPFALGSSLKKSKDKVVKTTKSLAKSKDKAAKNAKALKMTKDKVVKNTKTLKKTKTLVDTEAAERRMRKALEKRERQLVVRVVSALEEDLSNNFSKECLKSAFQACG